MMARIFLTTSSKPGIAAQRLERRAIGGVLPGDGGDLGQGARASGCIGIDVAHRRLVRGSEIDPYVGEFYFVSV